MSDLNSWQALEHEITGILARLRKDYHDRDELSAEIDRFQAQQSKTIRDLTFVLAKLQAKICEAQDDVAAADWWKAGPPDET